MSTAGGSNLPPDPLAGSVTGKESSLSSWAGPYVTNMLGMGQALAQQPYQAYTGPLTAGVSQGQQQAFSGIAGLNVPTAQMGAFTPTSFTAQPFQMGAPQAQVFQNKPLQMGAVGAAEGQVFQNKPLQMGAAEGMPEIQTDAMGLTGAGDSQLSSVLDSITPEMMQRPRAPAPAQGQIFQNKSMQGAQSPMQQGLQSIAQQYMSPYIQAALEPQLAEARRQADISRLQDAARLSKAGAFGGSRQAIMESEGQRNLLRNLADITGTGYQKAFEQAQQQFNVEQNRGMAAQELANRYGLDALTTQAQLGAQERAINQEAIDAARKQFEEERLFPYKNVQFMQSLLQGLPLATQSYSYQQPSGISELLGTSGGILGLLQNIAPGLFSGSESPNPRVDADIDYAANLPG